MLSTSSLCLAALAAVVAANPMPTPPALSAPSGSAQATPCTTYLTSWIYGFTGNWQPTITETVYTSTSTAYSRVPCGGCELVITTKLSPLYGGVGPVEKIGGTVTATQPSVTTATVCAAATTRPHGAIPRQEKHHVRDSSPSPSPSPSSSSICTSTLGVPITPTFGPVKTVWTKTKTVTSLVNCSGCSQLATTRIDWLNPGPVVIFSSTTTAKNASTTTAYACSQSVVSYPGHKVSVTNLGTLPGDVKAPTARAVPL